MKKLVAVLVSAVSLSAYAEFDQARFDKDTAYYNEHKSDAQAIITLLSELNTDRDVIKLAFEERANEDIKRWKSIVSKVNESREYGDKLEPFSHFSGCRNATIQATLAWNSGATLSRDFAEWDNENSFWLKQYKDAKKMFKEEYMACKDAFRVAPKKSDYEE